MFEDVLKIKEQIDTLAKAVHDNDLSVFGIYTELLYLSKSIDEKVGKDLEEMALAYEQYDDAMVVSNYRG